MFLYSWPGGSWEATLSLTLTVLGLYLGALWLTLVYWTYRDIRQRSRDPILQVVAVLLVLVFFLPGHWIYLIVRPRLTLSELYERSLEEEALLQELEDQKACPTCKRRVLDDFLICPSCRTRLKEPCRQCAKPLSYAWVACPFCGLEKPPREGMGARPARQVQRPPGAATTPAPQAPARPAPTRTEPARSTAPQAPAPTPTPAPRRSADPFGRPAALPADDEPMIGAVE